MRLLGAWHPRRRTPTIMIAAPLRTACFSSLRAAVRATPARVAPIRSFQTSSVSAAIKTLYTAEHEWIRFDDETNKGVLGITDHAQNSLGDVVYLELPAPGLEVSKGGTYLAHKMRLTHRPNRLH